jgi:hypothetical protein
LSQPIYSLTIHPWFDVSVEIHGHLDGRVAQLLLHVEHGLTGLQDAIGPPILDDELLALYVAEVAKP